MNFVYTGVPTGAKEFKYLTSKIKEDDLVKYPEITEKEFEELLRKASVGYGKPLPHRTKSICPESRKVVPAVVWEKDGKVWITKKCPEGLITELYYEDLETFERFRRWQFRGKVLKNYHVEKSGANCPFECGLCKRHYSHTCLLNIVVTNRCNLSCWYCFFFAKEGQPIYEPTLDQIRLMLRRAKEEIPPCNAIQLTGGEPTLRDDLIEIIKIAKEEGYDHVQLNTDGIKLAFDIDFVRKIRDAGVNTIYLSFDGVTPITNWKNHWEIPLIFKNIRDTNGPGLVLVPTLIRNINDSELGKIINFGLNHIDIVRGVNFQPISMVGRVPKEERAMFRITIPRALKLIEDQTNGAIAMEDWYPVPVAGYIARFFDAFLGKRYYMTSHFACGCATYVFLDDHKVIPITRFIDVDGFVEYLAEKAEEIKNKDIGKLGRMKVSADLVVKFLKKFYDESKAPKGLKVLNLIKNALLHGNYDALGEFHKKALFLGMMHFQDEYNYDVERTERCVIHYGMPDGKIVPFCAFNVIPEFYRDKIQPEFSYSWEEWKKQHPEWSYKKDKYVRTKEFIEKMMNSEIYRKTYNVKNYFE